MSLKETLTALEQRFWNAAGNATRYEEHLAADAVHVLPGMGIVDRRTVLAEVARAQPWSRFSISEPEVVDLGHDAAALVYRCHAARPGGRDYHAAVASVYRREGDDWLLAVHQQTPL
jgi:hypothetical protein